MSYTLKPLSSPDDALPGRNTPMELSPTHHVNKRNMMAEYPDTYQTIALGLGCFWGAERAFWALNGVWVTAVGYAGGQTPHPTYQEVCTGKTGHTEVVLVVFDPNTITVDTLLQHFFELHDPTQGMRQGNDHGTQYRSAIYFTQADQEAKAISVKNRYEDKLSAAGFPAITTEIKPLDTFYFAEDYHQQYLSKNPGGYCGLKGTGVECL